MTADTTRMTILDLFLSDKKKLGELSNFLIENSAYSTTLYIV